MTTNMNHILCLKWTHKLSWTCLAGKAVVVRLDGQPVARATRGSAVSFPLPVGSHLVEIDTNQAAFGENERMESSEEVDRLTRNHK